MIQASVLAGLECHRMIGAVQTQIPEIVNRDSKISLYGFCPPPPKGASMPRGAGSSKSSKNIKFQESYSKFIFPKKYKFSRFSVWITAKFV